MSFWGSNSPQQKKYCIPARFIKRGSERKWNFPGFHIFGFDMTWKRVRCELYVYGRQELCYKTLCSHVWILIDWDLAFPVSLLILCQLHQCCDKCLLTFNVSVCPCGTIWERLHDRLFRTALDQCLWNWLNWDKVSQTNYFAFLPPKIATEWS